MAFSAAFIQYLIVVNIYIVGALCVFGIAGNVLSIVVLGRDRTIRRTTAFLLQMLAVADAAFLVSCLVASTLGTALRWTDWLPAAVRRGWPFVFMYSLPTASITGTAAAWMVVVLTADRYVAICLPLHVAQYSTMPRLRRAVALVWVLAVIYNIPRVFESEVVEVEMEHTSSSELNRSTLYWRFMAMGKSSIYEVVYLTCLYFVFRILLPLVALVFFNQRLVRALRESHQMRRHSATDGGMGRQHTWMLVVVVIVCQLPTVVWSVCKVLYEFADVPLSRTVLNYALIAVNLMVTLNSSVNVVIYCFMGRQFRAILLHIVSCNGHGANARPNPEMDLEHHVVPLHHVPTPHPPEQSQPGRESPTCQQSTGDDAVCEVDVVVDVHHEMSFEAELVTCGVGRASTPRGDNIDK